MAAKVEKWMQKAAELIWDSSQIDVGCRTDDIEDFIQYIADCYAEAQPTQICSACGSPQKEMGWLSRGQT